MPSHTRRRHAASKQTRRAKRALNTVNKMRKSSAMKKRINAAVAALRKEHNNSGNYFGNLEKKLGMGSVKHSGKHTNAELAVILEMNRQSKRHHGE